MKEPETDYTRAAVESEDPKNKKVEKIEPYTVKITAKVLNVRKGPGKNFAVTSMLYGRDEEEITIVKESEGDGAKKWGKMKSGGWISLDHTTTI